MSVGNFSTSALPAEAYSGGKVLSGAREAKPDPASVQGSCYVYSGDVTLGTMIWIAVLVEGDPKWSLLQVSGFAGGFDDLGNLEPIDAYEFIPANAVYITTNIGSLYTYDGSGWVFMSPLHAPWVGAALSPDFGLPDPFDASYTLVDGDLGVTNIGDIPIWWRYCDVAKNWFRVAELGQPWEASKARASWFDFDHPPVVSGAPVTAQGWDSFTLNSCTLSGGKVNLAGNSTGGLYSASTTVSPTGKMAIIITGLEVDFPVGVAGQARAWSGALTTASADRLCSLQANPAWSPTNWHIGGGGNTPITGATLSASQTVEIYVDAAGPITVYLDRSPTPALVTNPFTFGSSTSTMRAMMTLSSITGGTATLKCEKFAAIAFNT